MTYNAERGRNFWYDFDNQTLFQRTLDFQQAFEGVLPFLQWSLDAPYDILRQSVLNGTYATDFSAAVSPYGDAFRRIAELQRQIFDQHFGADLDSLRLAIEDFGQGVLFDNRPPRPQGRHVHKMDGEVGISMVGYHRWHGFIRAAITSGSDGIFWERFDRYIAMAWAIQCEMRPEDDNPTNPTMSPQRLSELRSRWLSLQTEELLEIFAQYPTVAPLLEGMAAAAPVVVNFQIIRDWLSEAAIGAQPIHGGHRRFWELPYEQFVGLQVYGHWLIADDGPNRGARSALVRVLKGELEGIPRMPLNRPPLSVDRIQGIQSWIDAGLPP